MNPMGGLVTIGADGLGSGHRGHKCEVVVLEQKRGKVQMFIRGKEVRAQLVQRHRYAPLRIENERCCEAWEHLECTSVGSMSSGRGAKRPFSDCKRLHNVVFCYVDARNQSHADGEV